MLCTYQQTREWIKHSENGHKRVQPAQSHGVPMIFVWGAQKDALHPLIHNGQLCL